jgi:uncharacterized membrane protein YphA (DoxX/SURF4 family)
VIERLDAVLGRRIDLRPLAVLRVLVGPIVAFHLWGFLEPALDGLQYRDQFHEPYASWYPELPRAAYVLVLVAGIAAGVAMTLRVRPRAATIAAFAAVTYNVFLSTTHYRYNRGYLIIVLGALALTPAAPTGPAWTMLLLRIEAVVVYATSGITKLLDPDWFGGVVTHMRVVAVRGQLETDTPLPDWAIDLVTDRSFHDVAAKVVVLSEIVIALGLLWPRTRYAAIGLAVLFHLSIEATSTVQIFSALAIVALVIWLPPSALRRRAVSGSESAPHHTNA